MEQVWQQEQRNLDKCRRCRTKFDEGQSDGAEQKVTTSLQDTSKHPSSTLPSPTSSIRSTQSLESGDNGGPIGRETRRAFLNGGARNTVLVMHLEISFPIDEQTSHCRFNLGSYLSSLHTRPRRSRFAALVFE